MSPVRHRLPDRRGKLRLHSQTDPRQGRIHAVDPKEPGVRGEAEQKNRTIPEFSATIFLMRPWTYTE